MKTLLPLLQSLSMSSYESIDQQLHSLSIATPLTQEFPKAIPINNFHLHKSPYLDHPEPQLLATSVGKDSDGQIIPSTSTISLLSLNQDIPLNNRKNSHTTINHYMNQQRMQHYHKLTSPEAINIPDSPNLDPVSLHGSPSRFWLTNQTPPRSLSNSLSRTQLNQLFSLGMIKRVGSPNLVPVQAQDPPMTPLYLNESEGYFSYTKIDENEASEVETDIVVNDNNQVVEDNL